MTFSNQQLLPPPPNPLPYSSLGKKKKKKGGGGGENHSLLSSLVGRFCSFLPMFMSAWTNSTSGCSRGAWDTHTNTAARHFARHSDTAVSRQASDELAFQRLLNAAAVGWTSHHSTSVPLRWGGPVTTAHQCRCSGVDQSPQHILQSRGEGQTVP